MQHVLKLLACCSCTQVEALTKTLAQMQSTNSAYATSLRFADSEATQEQQRELR